MGRGARARGGWQAVSLWCMDLLIRWRHLRNNFRQQIQIWYLDVPICLQVDGLRTRYLSCSLRLGPTPRFLASEFAFLPPHLAFDIDPQAGFKALKSVGGMEAIAAHTSALARDLHAQLAALRHGNNDPVLRFFGRWHCSTRRRAGSESTVTRANEGSRARQLDRCSAATSVQYGESDAQRFYSSNGNDIPEGKGAVNGERRERNSEVAAAAEEREYWRTEGACQHDGVVEETDGSGGGVRNGQGPVIALGFLRPGRAAVGHAEVEKLAGLEGIQLRTGCFCNPGACQAALGLSDRDVMENLEK